MVGGLHQDSYEGEWIEGQTMHAGVVVEPLEHCVGGIDKHIP